MPSPTKTSATFSAVSPRPTSSVPPSPVTAGAAWPPVLHPRAPSPRLLLPPHQAYRSNLLGRRVRSPRRLRPAPLPRLRPGRLRLPGVRLPPRPPSPRTGRETPQGRPPPLPRPRPGHPPPRAPPAASTRLGARKPPVAQLQVLRGVGASLPRAPKQALLRGDLLRHRRRAPARLGRVRRRRRVPLARAPRDDDVVVDFDPWLFEARCVHAAGKIYWHICNSRRLLVLDPSTLKFSYLPVPDVLRTAKYRVGETPEDGRLCFVTDAGRQLQLWVRGEAKWSEKGWLLERKIVDLRVLCDMIPGLPRHPLFRTLSVWPSDMDAGRSGKVFISTMGQGRFSFHLNTGKMERLSTESGMDYGHPIFAYSLAWPPAFLSPEVVTCEALAPLCLK